jgi:hypothetical protein
MMRSTQGTIVAGSDDPAGKDAILERRQRSLEQRPKLPLAPVAVKREHLLNLFGGSHRLVFLRIEATADERCDVNDFGVERYLGSARHLAEHSGKSSDGATTAGGTHR